MLIGVKYCGGCNPEYERGKFVENLKSRFHNIHKFENVSLSTYYDVIIVVSGCTKQCASVSALESKNGLILVTGQENIDGVVDKVTSINLGQLC